MAPYQHPEPHVNLESVLKEKEEADEEELNSILEDLRKDEKRHYSILENRSQKGSQIFRYCLLILAASITSISFLFQSDIISTLEALNSWFLAVPLTLILVSMIFSIITFGTISWERKDLISRYELSPKTELNTKSSLNQAIENKVRLLKELREIMEIRKLGLFLSQISLLLAVISFYATLVKVLDLEKFLFGVFVASISLILFFLYTEYLIPEEFEMKNEN